MLVLKEIKIFKFFILLLKNINAVCDCDCDVIIISAPSSNCSERSGNAFGSEYRTEGRKGSGDQSVTVLISIQTQMVCCSSGGPENRITHGTRSIVQFVTLIIRCTTISALIITWGCARLKFLIVDCLINC